MTGADELVITVNTIILVCSLLLRRRGFQKAKKRRWWVRPSWRYRNLQGQASALLPRLRATDEIYFRDFLRMAASTLDSLLQLLRPAIERKVTPFRDPISAHDRLVSTLRHLFFCDSRFLANGDAFRSSSFNFLVGRSTAAGIVKETCAAMWNILQPIYVRFPQGPTEWKKIAAEIDLLWNFPNCIGCIDGKHVNIKCPSNSGARNLNYKKTISTVLMAVSDARYSFTYVDIGDYGGESDRGVYSRTPLFGVLADSGYGIPPPANVGSAGPIPYLMVGDEAFPLKPFLMRPYPGRGSEPDQEEYLKMATFNYRLSRARRLIENAFGIMASRWRILRRAFRASEETTKNIVKACVALHNFLLKNSAMSRSAYNPPGYVDSEDWQGNLTHGSWRNDDRGLPLRDMAGLGSHSPGTALAVRDRLATYFLNDGKVPWQERIVTRA
ncbi:unnamed protein product, partial [Ixodes pacificus]